MIFGQIRTFIQATFMQAPQVTYGRIYHRKNEDTYKLYKLYDFFTKMLCLVCSVALSLTLSFIENYTEDAADVVYIDVFLTIFFMLTLFMTQMRVPSMILFYVAVDYEETQKRSYYRIYNRYSSFLGVVFWDTSWYVWNVDRDSLLILL